MELIPASDIALASKFASYAAAEKMADAVGFDDPEWNYDVRQIAPGKFVIAVYDSPEEDGEFLGYL